MSKPKQVILWLISPFVIFALGYGVNLLAEFILHMPTSNGTDIYPTIMSGPILVSAFILVIMIIGAVMIPISMIMAVIIIFHRRPKHPDDD